MTDRPLRILVVEDDTNDFASLNRVFRLSECEVELRQCVRGEDALVLIQTDPSAFDIVVIDYRLPGMNGVELARKLLEMAVPFPLMMLTGSGNELAAVEAMKLGVYDYVVKDHQAELSFLPKLITDLIKTHENVMQLRKAETQVRKLSAAVEQSSSVIMITDAQGHIEYVNPAFARLTGYTSEEALGRTPDLLKSGQMAREVYEELWANLAIGAEWRGELQNRKKNGELYWARVTISPIRSEEGLVTHFLEIQEDITEARQLSDLLYYQARHDSLTGLINRREFEHRVQRLLDKVRIEHTKHALCYLDLDQFKIVNDTCGHVAGDELLRQVGHLLREHIRQRDTVARLGGDEFGLLMEYCPLEAAEKILEKQLRILEDFRFIWEDKSFVVGASIGLVLIDEHAGSLSDILREADAACYAAKDQGRHRIHVYHPDDERLARFRSELQWVSRINQALETDHFVLYQQRIISLHEGVDDGEHYEILIRMEENEELFLPGCFLPAAERYNLALKIDRWVVSHTLAWLTEHPDRLNRLYLCPINLSAHSLGNDEFLTFLMEQFAETGVPPEKICFEITETAAIVNLARAFHFIKTLKAFGCRFALDDFGSGLSSFGYLKNLPVDYLKIDGMFVKDMVKDPIDYAMVKSINEIGHVMGIKTIAEYVENDRILAKLKEIGVDYAQGYCIAEPQPLI